MTDLTKSERKQIAEILDRRASEVARFNRQYTEQPEHYGSVELAHKREIERLRHLANRVNPAEPEEEE